MKLSENELDYLVSLSQDYEMHVERRAVLERLIKARGYISIEDLCAIFDIKAPKAEPDQKDEEEE